MKTYDPNKTAAEVRQANQRRMTLRVLFLSTLGLAVIFGVVYFVFLAVASNTGGV